MRKFLLFVLVPAFFALTACQKSSNTEETAPASPEASASMGGAEASSAAAASPEAGASPAEESPAAASPAAS